MSREGLVALVIHHRNYPGVLVTVNGLIGQGLDSKSILLVDNSEDSAISEQLLGNLPRGVGLLATKNGGYAKAVNDGLAYSGWLTAERFIAVVTHEVIPQPYCFSNLISTLASSSDIGVVGPTLRYERDGSSQVWSKGGSLRALTGAPYHVRSRDINGSRFDDPSVPRDREWLDGALNIYRAEALLEHPLDEKYFLYLEETDCHARMRKGGWRVVWVPDSVATQQPSGMPPYLHGRNLTWYLKKHGNRVLWPLGLLGAGVRLGVSEVVGRASRGSTGSYIRGIRDALSVSEQ